MDGQKDGRSKPIVFASVYMAHETTAPPHMLEGLVEYCTVNRLPLVVGADANAHNEVWGSTDNNERGEYLLNYLAGTNMTWANSGNKPTFITRNRREVFDITLISEELRGSIGNWHVSDIPSMSDHCFIRFNVKLTVEKGDLYRQVRNTNWNDYKIKLEMELQGTQQGLHSQIHSTEEFDRAADLLTQSMQKS